MYTGSRQIVQQQDAGCVTSGMQDARHWKCKMQDNEDTLGRCKTMRTHWGCKVQDNGEAD